MEKASTLRNALDLNVLAVDSCSYWHGIRCRLLHQLPLFFTPASTRFANSSFFSPVKGVCILPSRWA